MVKRSAINMSFAGAYEYMFIDHVKNGGQFGGAGQTAWNTGAVWTQNIDADGWPTYSTAVTNKQFGICGLYLPASTDYTGTYTIDGFGSGTINFAAGSWAIGVATGVTLAGSTLTVTDQGAGVRWHAVLTYTGSRANFGMNAPTCDPANTGKFLKYIRFYRTGDAADLAQGKVFRTPWKQTLVDLNPSVIRVMNWTGGNNARNIRFENRALPSYACWHGPYNYNVGPRYGETTGANQMVLAAVTGTPGSMQHGEIACCRILNSLVRVGTFTGVGVDRVVQNITNANPAAVQCTAHGFNTGDKIVHFTAGGMANLKNLPCTVTVVDADNYTINVDTTTFGAFTALTTTGTTSGGSIVSMGSVVGLTVGMSCSGPGIPSGTVVNVIHANSVDLSKNTTGTNVGQTYTFGASVSVNQWISLTVGTGNDRNPTDGYPVVFASGANLASHFGDGYIAAHDYKTFYFDKTMSFKTDGAGNNIYGVWIFPSNGTQLGHDGGVPLEICTTLINELMAMARTDGGAVGPIDLWVTIPHMAMMADDPDYSASSDFAIKTVDVCLNGANGFAGLDARCKLFVEYANETWNGGTDQQAYLQKRGQLRWGNTTPDINSFSTLRFYLMAKALRAAYPGNARIKYVMAGQGGLGWALSSSNGNYVRVYGSTAMLTDPFVASAVPAYSLNQTGATPYSVMDHFAWAAYLYSADNSASFSYSLGTCVTAWLAAGSDSVAQEAAFAAYVSAIKTSGGSQTIDSYYGTIMPAYAAAMVTLGKTGIMYEGGWDRATVAGQTGWSSSTGNTDADTSSFLLACKKSRSWAYALKNAFDLFDATTGVDFPMDYIEVDNRWGHAAPDLYAGGVEGANLDMAWTMMALRNRGRSRLNVKT